MRKVIVWLCTLAAAFFVGCSGRSRFIGSEHLYFKEGILSFSEKLKTYILVPHSNKSASIYWGDLNESGTMELESGSIVSLKKGTIYVLSPDRCTVEKEIPATARNLIMCAYHLGRDEIDMIGGFKCAGTPAEFPQQRKERSKGICHAKEQQRR